MLVAVEELVNRGTIRREYRSNWKGPVAGCPIPERHKVSTCRHCMNVFERAYKKAHPLSGARRLKDNARSYAGIYLRRGKITKGPCIDCGSENSQMHHEDYSKPTEVLWLCRACHMDRHKASGGQGIALAQASHLPKERTPEQRSLDSKPNWRGPLPGCSIKEPHPCGRCRQCHIADMRQRRRNAKTAGTKTPAETVEGAEAWMPCRRTSSSTGLPGVPIDFGTLTQSCEAGAGTYGVGFSTRAVSISHLFSCFPIVRLISCAFGATVKLIGLESRIDALTLPEPMSGCWLWLGRTNNDGYPIVQVGESNHSLYRRGKILKVHRVNYERFIRPIPVGLLVRHKCDLPLCVNPYHGIHGTSLDNFRDAVERGHIVLGKNGTGFGCRHFDKSLPGTV